jgi:hypothetical protein
VDERGTRVTRIIDDEDIVAGGVVRRYLESQAELAARLTATGVPVVVFAPAVDMELVPDYFERVQAALTAAAAKHGRGLYVASVHARPLIYAGKPFPRLHGGRGAFIGYFAVGEGGALFFQPNGEVGIREALFDEAIGAMMLANR